MRCARTSGTAHKSSAAARRADQTAGHRAPGGRSASPAARTSTTAIATYFSWLELTRDGRPHYHAMLIDPPFRDNAETKAWLESIWGIGYVKIRRKPREWFTESAGAYVGKYAKKFGDKAYQQFYENVPREIRTFECNRLEHTQEELKEHEPVWEAHFVPEAWDYDYKRFTPAHLELTAKVEHIGRCAMRFAATPRRRVSQSLRRPRAPGRSPPDASSAAATAFVRTQFTGHSSRPGSAAASQELDITSMTSPFQEKEPRSSLDRDTEIPRGQCFQGQPRGILTYEKGREECAQFSAE